MTKVKDKCGELVKKIMDAVLTDEDFDAECFTSDVFANEYRSQIEENDVDSLVSYLATINRQDLIDEIYEYIGGCTR